MSSWSGVGQCFFDSLGGILDGLPPLQISHATRAVDGAELTRRALHRKGRDAVAVLVVAEEQAAVGRHRQLARRRTARPSTTTNWTMGKRKSRMLMGEPKKKRGDSSTD